MTKKVKTPKPMPYGLVDAYIHDWPNEDRTGRNGIEVDADELRSMLARIEVLRAENADLTGRAERALVSADACAMEIVTLRAENERLRGEVLKRQMTLDEATKPLHVEIENLRAENERLKRHAEELEVFKALTLRHVTPVNYETVTTAGSIEVGRDD